MADSRSRTAGTVYRDDAADIMAAAARGTLRPSPSDLELTARRAAPVVQPEPERPLPYPEPVGINDNDDDVPQPVRAPQKRVSFGRRLARIAIAPLYLVVAAGSVAVIGLFAKGLLGF